MSDEQVIIVGGGIGGLGTAIALERAGVPFTLIERAPQLRGVGAAIQLWTNAIWALEQLGLTEEAEAIGHRIDRMMFRSWRGDTLVDIPIGELATQGGAKPPLLFRRRQLLDLLVNARGEASPELPGSVASIEQDAGGVTATLDDGREVRGSALVAADGARSAIRAKIFPGTETEYRGYQYLRALAPPMLDKITPGVSTFLLGRGDRFGIEGGPTWTYWFGAIRTAEGTGDSERGRKQDLLDRFRDFASPVLEAIEATPEEEIGRSDIYDFDPLDHWVDGRVVLMGDAAHAVTPNRGRGGAEALEDAVVLGECLAAVDSLADGDAVTRALQEFESRRLAPAVSIQKSARKIGELANWRNPVACALREFLMKKIVSRAMLKEMREECVELGARTAVPPG